MKYIIGDDNDIAIEFTRVDNNVFSFNNDNSYICNIKLYNYLSQELLSINTNYIDILNLIDTIETFMGYPAYFTELFHQFISTDLYSHILFQLNREDNKIYIKVFEYINESLLQRYSINVTNVIDDILIALYEEFILDEDGNPYDGNISNMLCI